MGYDNLINDILSTFPNLAWLTLENEQFLTDSERFHDIVENEKNINNLKWITLCASEKDEIYSLSNGVYIEYWDRGIEQCDFDGALQRSQEIINDKNDNKQLTNRLNAIQL